MAERCLRTSAISRRDLVKAGAAAGVGITVFGAAGLHRSGMALQKSYRIAFIQGVIGDNFYITMNCGAQAKATELGNITVETQGPAKFDQTLQTPILNAVVQSKPDAIMIAPNDAQGMIAPITAAVNAGIPVLCVDTTINSDVQLANIATDNEEGGRLAAQGLAAAIGKKGKVFVVNVQPGVSTTDLRGKGFEEEIKNYPDIQYLGMEYCNDDANVAAQIVSARLQSDPDLSGIFGTNLFAAQGSASAIRQAGKTGVVKIVGFDAGPTQVQDLKSGAADLLIAQHPGDIGESAVQLLHDYLADGTKPENRNLVTGATIVTRDNINDPNVTRYLYVADCSNYKLSNATPIPAAPAASPAATPTA